MFRLKSQKGAFELAKASSGGQGIRRLIAIDLPKKGYTIPMLKEIVCSSVLYIIPLNSNIDMEPVTINDLQTIADDDKEKEWECETCMKLVPANQFREHESVCLEESFQVSFPSKTTAHCSLVLLQFLYKWSRYIDFELYKNSFKNFFI